MRDLEQQVVCGLEPSNGIPYHSHVLQESERIEGMPRLICNDARKESCPFYSMENSLMYCHYEEERKKKKQDILTS